MIEEVFQTIKGSINKQYFGNSKFYYNKSATTGLYSLMVESSPSLYHLDTSAHLFARVKLSGKLQYISFSGTFEKDFAALNIPFTKIASDDFVRIDIEYFLNIALNNSAVHKLLNRIYTSSFSFPSFGCCAKYVECSNAGHCLHTDILYASAACQYKHNLDAGRIFYATNKI